MGEVWYFRLIIGVVGVGDEEMYVRMIVVVNKDFLVYYDLKFEFFYGGWRLILF